jgi:hypothetical protein
MCSIERMRTSSRANRSTLSRNNERNRGVYADLDAIHRRVCLAAARALHLARAAMAASWAGSAGHENPKLPRKLVTLKHTE